MVSAKRKLYLYDMERESLMLWLSEFEGESGTIWKSPVSHAWSPDGKWVAFSAISADTQFNIFVAATDQVIEPTRLTESDFRQYVWSWSPSGNEILFGEQHGQPSSSSTYWDIYELPLHPPAPALPLLACSPASSLDRAGLQVELAASAIANVVNRYCHLGVAGNTVNHNRSCGKRAR